MAEVRFSFEDPEAPDCEHGGEAHFPRSRYRARLLADLQDIARRRKLPIFTAYEHDRPSSIGLTNIHKVLSLNENEARLSNSHAKHRIDADVLPALEVGNWYKMAIDPASGKILSAVRSDRHAEHRQISPYSIDPCSLPAVSWAKVENFFSSVRRQPHIPFQYPLDGCWARAHEMGRLIERFFDCDPRTITAKIWNFGDLHVETDNNPYCKVCWNYHVAPILKTDHGFTVIDPSLFDQPVSVDTWRNKQSDLSRKSVFTSLDIYNSIDDQFISEPPGQTELDLGLYRGALTSSIYCHGPIPYRCK